MDKIDDYRFYYGIKDYKNIKASDLIKESNLHHNNISTNALHCIMQFISLSYGARGNYMFNEIELEKILRPVYYGIGKDTDRTPEEIERLPLKFKNIYRYINEWHEEIKKYAKIVMRFHPWKFAHYDLFYSSIKNKLYFCYVNPNLPFLNFAAFKFI